MLSFGLKGQAERTMELPGGGSITYRAVTKTSFDAAKASAKKQKADIVADPERLKAAGLTPADVESPAAMEALYTDLLIGELGARHATAWTGVADVCGLKEAPCTPENVRQLLKHQMAAEEFFKDVLSSMLPDIQLKKDLGTDAPGTTAAVPATADLAKTTENLAPSAGGDLTVTSAPT
ncbi:MAG: hypothetical protein ACAH80_18620 [Alphaproteobacteria bacterium]